MPILGHGQGHAGNWALEALHQGSHLVNDLLAILWQAVFDGLEIRHGVACVTETHVWSNNKSDEPLIATLSHLKRWQCRPASHPGLVRLCIRGRGATKHLGRPAIEPQMNSKFASKTVSTVGNMSLVRQLCIWHELPRLTVAAAFTCVLKKFDATGWSAVNAERESHMAVLWCQILQSPRMLIPQCRSSICSMQVVTAVGRLPHTYNYSNHYHDVK